MKRIFTGILSVMLLCMSCISFVSCGSAPKIEELYDRVVELVEGANELNTLYYGAGLPVYEADSEYAELTQMYYQFSYTGSYEMVTPYAKFATVSQIETASEKIYSKNYLEEVVYPALFTGYAIQGISGVQVAGAKYLEDGDWIYQSVSEGPLYTGMIVYDYSTMHVTPPGNREACYVTMNAWMEDTPEQVTEVRLRLVLQDGQWYLDSFTGGSL